MARFISSTKLLVGLVANNSFVAITRRSFAAASHGQAPGGFAAGGSRIGIVRNSEHRASMKDTSAASAWAPDPATGYYRPSNLAVELDAAELRAMLLKHKMGPQ